MATEHHFSIEDAINHGVEAAVVLHNLRFWLDKNKANRKNIHDGRVWTYNSQEAWLELLPYLTRSKVQRIIRDLSEKKILLRGNYNKNRFDQTSWYSLNEAKYQAENYTTKNGEIGLEAPESLNARNRSMGCSKPCNVTDKKPYKKQKITTTTNNPTTFDVFMFALVDMIYSMIQEGGWMEKEYPLPKKSWLVEKAKDLYNKLPDPRPADCAVIVLKDWVRLVGRQSANGS